MQKFLSLLVALVAFAGSLSAQSNAEPPRHQRTYDPMANEVSRDSFEAARFDRQLSALREAFQAQDMASVTYQHAQLLGAMRHEIGQLEAKVGSGAASAARLTEMQALLEAFEGHDFDVKQPAAAERAFERYAAFLNLIK